MYATTSQPEVAQPDSFVIHHERNWQFLVFIPVWLAAWLFFEILVGYFILRGLLTFPAEILRDGWWAVGGGLLILTPLIAWFVLWTYCGLMLLCAWLWNAFGYEILSVGNGALTIECSCLGWRRVSTYAVKSLRQTEQWGRSGKMMRVGQIRLAIVGLLTFDYRRKKVEFGFGITNTAADTILRQLSQMHPLIVAQDEC